MRTVRRYGVLLAAIVGLTVATPTAAFATPEDEGFVYVGTFPAPRGADLDRSLVRAAVELAGPDACADEASADPDGLAVAVYRNDATATIDYVWQADGRGWAGPCASGLYITIKLIDTADNPSPIADYGSAYQASKEVERAGYEAPNEWWNVNTDRDGGTLTMRVTEFSPGYVRGAATVTHRVWGRYRDGSRWLPIPCMQRAFRMVPGPTGPTWLDVGHEVPCPDGVQ